MAHPTPRRLPLLLASSAAAAALAAAPALGSEPDASAGTLPTGIAPVTFAPVPSVAPARRARVITRARLVPRRVRRGRRPLLRVSLATPSRLRIVVSRRTGRGRVRAVTLTVPARGRTVTLRLPVRSHGRNLRPGRYRVNLVAIDAQGTRSLPVNRRLVVRPR